MVSRKQKLCHLCGVLYWDDPFMVETPGHTSEQCLAALRFRVNQSSLEFYTAQDNLKRAEREYKKVNYKEG